MTAPEFDHIAKTAPELQSAITEIRDQLSSIQDPNGQSIDLNENCNTTDTSFDFALDKILFAIECALDLGDIESTIAIPSNQVAHTKKTFSDLENHVNQLYTNVNSLLAAGVSSINITNFVLQSNNNQSNLNLPNNIKTIYESANQFMQTYYIMTVATKGTSHHNFSHAYKNLKESRSEFRQLVNELKKHLQQTNKTFEQIEEHRKQSENLKSEIERIQNEAQSSSKTISEYESETTQKLTSVRDVHQKAEQLRQTVEEFQADFDNFQSQLDSREDKLRQGNTKQQKLIEELENLRTTITDINDQAEAMLSGATVAGLASSFGGIRDKLHDELKTARKAFYTGICILFVSAIPLTLYVLPQLFGSAVRSGEAIELDIVQIIGRALLLIPGAWLTRFAAARHAALFRLKEHYAYKYSIAASVEGFKRQATNYEEEIAAATFFELTFNPGDKMDKSDDTERHPNPIINKVMDKMGFTRDGGSH